MKIKWWNKILLFGIPAIAIMTPTFLSIAANNITPPREENLLQYIDPIFVPVKDSDYFSGLTGYFGLMSSDTIKNTEYILDKNVFNNFINKYDGVYNPSDLFGGWYELYLTSYSAFKEITSWNTISYLFYDSNNKYDKNYKFNNNNIILNDNSIDKLDITLKIFLHNNNDKDKIYISWIECSIIINDNFRKKGYRWKLDPNIYRDVYDLYSIKFAIDIEYA